MNTLPHVAAEVALLWLSVFAFQTLSQDALGFAALVLFVLFIPLTLLAAQADWNALMGKNEGREG